MASPTTSPARSGPAPPHRLAPPAPSTPSHPGGEVPRRLLAVLFTATGASALTLQVVWQRVISLHSGVDLSSTTTVVAAFLAGLGLGSLAGGRLADRLGPRRSLQLFAGANVAIAVLASVSTWLFYDLYQQVAPSLDTVAASFAFNAAVVIVPTTLMGLSLPLLTRGVVDRLADAGPVVGRFYALNTVGAALGAAITGWLLLGTLGFVAVTRLAGLVNLAVGLTVLVLLRGVAPDRGEQQSPAEPDFDSDGVAVARRGAIWPWMVAYAGTGAVALGLQQVFFRLIDAVMRSNSYSFAHVLSLYLVLFGIGAGLGSRLVRRGVDPRRWFLLLQGGVAASALGGLVLFTRVLPAVGLREPLADYFATEGFSVGFGSVSSARELVVLGFAFVGAPLLLMGIPVLCAGASYPCIQATVSDRFERLGRRTGLLMFANVAGNVVGTLLTGFVLIDWLGTAGTLRMLAAVLGLGVAVAMAVPARAEMRRRLPAVVAAGLMVVALVVAVPSNKALWAFLHGVETDQLQLEEQRSCAVTLRRTGDSDVLHINASSQNGYPFDDFHVLIGLLPALLHPAPDRALAIGMGIGATAYGMASEPRVGRIDAVELCGGQYPLLERLGETRAPELRRLFGDERVSTHVGDGRKFLLTEDERFDVVTVDTLRPQSGFSGSLYSVEFYRLVASRLAPNGLLVQWVPTNRVLHSVTAAFPHVVTLGVQAYGGSRFMLASQQPITVDPQATLDRFDAVATDAYSIEQRGSLEAFLAQMAATCVADGTAAAEVPDHLVNRDLAPRDEYFLNNKLDVAAPPGCS